MADAASPGLERVTTRYSVKQDRICLAGELPGGSPVVLWLTQRLLRRLLPPLLVWLQEQGGAANAVMGQALYADALQGFAQQAARAQLQPQAPVQVPEGSLSCLVEGVDMGRSPEAVRLVFRDAQGVVAAMVLHPQPLLYLGLGIAWAATLFGRVLSMLSDRGLTIRNWLALVLEAALAAGAFAYALSFVP